MIDPKKCIVCERTEQDGEEFAIIDDGAICSDCILETIDEIGPDPESSDSLNIQEETGLTDY